MDYCIRCGARLPSEADFCARCGAEVINSESSDVSRNPRSDPVRTRSSSEPREPALVLKILSGIAFVIGAMLFWGFNASLFTVGPGTTIERGRDLLEWIGGIGEESPQQTGQVAIPPTEAVTQLNRDCAGIVAWSAETEDRGLRHAELSSAINSLDPDDTDSLTLLDWADELDQLGQAQAGSRPPPIAEKANKLIVQIDDDLADLFRFMARSLSVTPTAAETRHAEEILSRFTNVMDDVDQETARIFEACSDEFYQASIDSEAKTAVAGPTRITYSCDGFKEWGDNIGAASGLSASDAEAWETKTSAAFKDLDVQRLRYLQGKVVDRNRLVEISADMDFIVATLDKVQPPPIAAQAHKFLRETYLLVGEIAESLWTNDFEPESWARLNQAATSLAAEAEFMTQQCG